VRRHGVGFPQLGVRPRCRLWTDLRAAPAHLACRCRALLSIVQVINLADVLGSMHQLEADALAVTTGREPPALDDRHLVRHVGMLGVMGDPVDPRFRRNYRPI